MMSEELGIYLITMLAASNLVQDFMIGSGLTVSAQCTEVFRLLVQDPGSNTGTCALIRECAVCIFAVYTAYSRPA